MTLLHRHGEKGFLSTLPARGATLPAPTSTRALRYFYPRSPRGERLPEPQLCRVHHRISIHAPREGSDMYFRCLLSQSRYFYPRSPRGERPWYAASAAVQGNISIHAPREGSDQRDRPAPV